MLCPIKNIPKKLLVSPKPGNRGVGFPLNVVCEKAFRVYEHNCYLVLELGDDPLMRSPIVAENGTSFILAPCSNEDVECYLVTEEDGETLLEMEETTDGFLIPCNNITSG